MTVELTEFFNLYRFCPQVYHPFDPLIVDKYVVGDEYVPTWQVLYMRNSFYSQICGHKRLNLMYEESHKFDQKHHVGFTITKICTEILMNFVVLFAVLLRQYKDGQVRQ